MNPTSKKTLSQFDFVDAALTVIEQVGVEKLSMRRVATVLGVSPMALYRHFPDKQSLLSAALDEFICRADVIPEQELPWQQWITMLANNMYRALVKELSWIPVLGSLQLGENAATVTQALIQKLTAEGFSEKQAFEAYLSVIQLMIGAVCLKASLQKQQGEAEGTEVSAVEPLQVSMPLLIKGLQH